MSPKRNDKEDYKNLYESIFELTGTATIIVDEDTTILMANQEFCKLVECTKQEIDEKQSWTTFVHEDDLHTMRKYHEQRRIDPSKAPRNYEARVIGREGQKHYVYVTVGVIPGTKKSIISFEDISVLKLQQLEYQRIEILLKEQNDILVKKNMALQEVLSTIEQEKASVRHEIIANIERFLMPVIDAIKRSDYRTNKEQIEMLESQIADLSTSLGKRLSKDITGLTPKELDICSMVKSGYSTKEIAVYMRLSPETITTHRKNIRRKLGIKNDSKNLASYLVSIM